LIPVENVIFCGKIADFREAVSRNVVQNGRFSTSVRGLNSNYKSAFCSTMTRELFMFWTRFLLWRRINLQGFENK
jgi:hypothetical protein